MSQSHSEQASSAPRVEDLLIDGPWQHHTVHSRGQRFHYAQCGQNSDPLVLLIHGASGGWFDWRHVMEPLADSGFRVVAVSLRGWCTSDRTPTGYRTDIAAEDMTGVIRALGHERAFVIGHDLGGFITWTMAAQEPRLVRGAVSVGAPNPLIWLNRQVINSPLQRRLMLLALQLSRTWGPGAGSPEAWADTMLELAGSDYRSSDDFQITHNFHVKSLAAGALHPAAQHTQWLARPWAPGRARWRVSLREAVNVARSIGGIPPVLLINGAEDRLPVPSVAQEEQETSLNDASLDNHTPLPHLIDGAGHFPHLEKPEEFLQAVGTMLDF